VAGALPELNGRVVQESADRASRDALLRVHTVEHLARVAAASRQSAEVGQPVLAGPETPLSPASWDAIVGSAGAAVEAVSQVARGRLRNAFVATRPPGHHASSAFAMGFCPVNHVAVAARHLQAAGLAERVAIVDWDVHHGNGTQDLFYEDGSVYFLSLHQYPFYPGTGPAEERGAGAGLGTTLNVPITAGTGSVEYLTAFEAALAQVESEFEPDFVLISAGYDTLSQDPLGGLLVEPDDFTALTRLVCTWADRVCQGRVVALLEGGYHPEQTAEAAVTTLLALAED
jgi:acetoin utilization deacetylase AcuC-like enzyme